MTFQAQNKGFFKKISVLDSFFFCVRLSDTSNIEQ